MENLLFLDTETTALENGRLVQLAIAVNESDVTSTLWKPPVPIEFEAMAVHHITERDVAEADAFTGSGVAVELQKVLKNAVMVAHNAPFDIGVLSREGVTVHRFIDTLKVARRLWPRMKSHRLQVLRYALGIEIEAKAHDAAGDVEVLRGLFIEILIAGFKSGKFDNDDHAIATMERWTVEPVTLYRMPFGKHSGKTFEEIEATDRDYLHWVASKSGIEDADVIHTAKAWLLDQAAARKETEV
jgi:exodeoxyribonuclease X